MDTIGNRLWDTWQGSGGGSGKNTELPKPETNSKENNHNIPTTNDMTSSIGALFNKAVESVETFNMSHSNSEVKNNSSKQKSINSDEVKSSVRMNKSKSVSNIDEETIYGNTNNTSTTTSSYADKFMERIISMAIPTTTTSSKRELHRILNRIEIQKSRPQLSMQTMSKNSILLLQRLSVPFETIDWFINFFNWENPIITIIGMLFLSLCILKPINFLTIPLFYICFEIIIPAYSVQNPNNDESVEVWENELPKPVNEFSREFLLNVTDLQNHMLLYVNSWNFVVSWCYKLFYFRDEMLTWFIFVILFVSGLIIETCGMKLIILFFPYLKLLLVINSWILIILLHPQYRLKILETFYSEELRIKTMSLINHFEFKMVKDLDLNFNHLEIRQIEIYELQYFNDDLKIWQFVCYSKDSYPPNDHIRLNKLPIDGTLTLESIIPPDGWKFINNNNDLSSKKSSSKSDDNNTNKSNMDTNGNNDNSNNNNYNSNNNKNNNNNIDESNSYSKNNDSSSLLSIDYEKTKILKDKKRHQKYLKKQQRKSNKDKLKNKYKSKVGYILNKSSPEFNKRKSNINKRRASNDFSQVLLDPLVLNNKLIKQLETGIKLDGWYMDLSPSKWVNENYLEGVVEIDENSKWVYDLVVMGNGVDAYSAGLGVGLGTSKDKLKRSRGDVRRRRWVRYVVREIVRDEGDTSQSGNDSVFVEESEEEESTSTSTTEDESEFESEESEGGDKGDKGSNSQETETTDNHNHHSDDIDYVEHII